MSDNPEPNQNPTSGTPRIEDLPYRLGVLKLSLEELAIRVRSLTRVEKDGRSECPFAENEYALKEDEAKKVHEALINIRPFMPLVNGNIAHWSEKLNSLEIDEAFIGYEKAKDEYDRASQTAKHYYQKALEGKRYLLELMDMARQQLKMAAGKPYPPGKPRKRYQPNVFGGGIGAPASLPSVAPMPMPGLPAPNMTMGTNVALADPMPKSTMSDLISMGPIGTKGK